MKAARTARGLTQRELAVLLDTDPMSVSRWERGKVMPGMASLVGLSTHLGESVSWFYEDRVAA